MIQARMALTLILALGAGHSVGLAQPQREITPIKGDLYRFRNAGHFSKPSHFAGGVLPRRYEIVATGDARPLGNSI